MIDLSTPAIFPVPLDAYPPTIGFLAAVRERVDLAPFNAVATAIFFLAVLHTFTAGRFSRLSRDVQNRHDQRARRAGHEPSPSVAAELLHFVGEVEVVFGLWAIVLVAALTIAKGWDTARHYLNDTVDYTEPLFVVVIMALASTRPIVSAAESGVRLLARLGGSSPGAWWLAILTVGPLLGSFITEPAAMTICALLLASQFFAHGPSPRLKYATLGLLFVNVSIGGTLTHFAAPPVLIVARAWNWDTPFMLAHFGERAVLGVVVSNALYYVMFRREFNALAQRAARGVEPAPRKPMSSAEVRGSVLPAPAWVVLVHAGFIAWTVINSHYPALFLGGFLLFLGFAQATAQYQNGVDLRGPLLVGFFLGGLVIHGALQGWWIGPLLSTLSERPLFFGAAALTAFNDNALVTYLATLVPDLSVGLRTAVVQGAIVGGGLTVIANAPNPAGQALLARFFGGVVNPLGLLLGALLPTLISLAAFRL